MTIGNSTGAGDDSELKIDEQVQKFLELNHTLTFFLVTASVGSLGFTLTYAKEQSGKSELNFWLLLLMGISAVLALLAAWAGLRALMHDQSSFRKHLAYRYQRKTYNQLTQRQQNEWEEINGKAASARKAAFSLLAGTVIVQVLFLFLLLATKGDLPMHHYGEDSTHVAVGESHYHLEFRNKVSGAVITMEVPAVGSLEDPKKRLEPGKARALATEVAHLLRRVLE